MGRRTATADELLQRITVDPKFLRGKPIIRGRRLAAEHVLGMLAAGDSPETILDGYPWLEAEDIRACLVYAHRRVARQRVDLTPAAAPDPLTGRIPVTRATGEGSCGGLCARSLHRG